MKKYRVTIYFHSSVQIEVDAEGKSDAIEKAKDTVYTSEYRDLMLENIAEDDFPEVQEL